jgi:hypothetical protein
VTGPTKHKHPVAITLLAATVPFLAGVAFYFVVANYAPGYPQSIRESIEAHLQGTPRVPTEVAQVDADSSTLAEEPAHTSTKPYAASGIDDSNVGDTSPESRPYDTSSAHDRHSATWNSTNSGATDPSHTPDVVDWDESQTFAASAKPDTFAKIRQLEALSKASGQGAVRACIEALVDDDPAVRRTADSTIARLNGTALYREWMNILLHGPEPLLLELDALLPRLLDPLEPNALAQLAAGDSMQQEKLGAMYTLGRIRSSSAIAILTGYAWSEDLLLAQTATAALAEIRSPDAVGALTDLTGHYDPDVRWYATNGLGLVGTDDATAALEDVLLSYEEPVADIQILAAEHLGEAGQLASAHALLQALRTFPRVRPSAMYALSQITGIEDFAFPHEWYTWYDEWSQTEEAALAVRVARTPPPTEAAVMPVQAQPVPPSPSPSSEAPVSEPVALPPAPSPEAVAAQPAADSHPETEPTPADPKTARAKSPPTPPANTGKGGFTTSDLTPAELMRRGGFGNTDP